jgi:hypothetical protein
MWLSKAAALTRMPPPRGPGLVRARKTIIIKGHARDLEKKIHSKSLNQLRACHRRRKREVLHKNLKRYNSGPSRARGRPRVNYASIIMEIGMQTSSRAT